MSELDTFSMLPAPLASALEKRGYSELTPVQQAVLAEELRGKDLRISSRTGSGKTVALGLVVGPLLIDRPAPPNAPTSLCAHPRILLVAPTRELAAQIGRELEWLYAELKVGVCVVTGGTSITGERRQLARGPLVVVGTPGRLCDHLARGALDLSQAEAMVLDEADQMLELGFREALETLLAEIPATCRRHLVSATFPRAVLALASQFQTNAVTVTGGSVAESQSDITHLAYLVHPRERYAALVNVLLMAPDERTLVFVRTRIDAAEVAGRLCADGLKAGALSGEMAQAERTRMLDAFRGGSVGILVCTDVASRGIDVPEVGRVIHAELPNDPASLTHRSGRTGRAGRKGLSIMLVASNERGPAETLLMRAGIHSELLTAPTQEIVRAECERRLFESLAGDAEEPATEPSDEQAQARDAALAARLIEAVGPEQAVERLLARLRRDGPSDPQEVTSLPLDSRAQPRVSRAPQRRAPMPRRARHG